MPGRGSGVGAAMFTLALVLASCTGDGAQRSPTPSATATSARGPSQSPSDAKRDRVPSEIAELPFRKRVEPIATVRVDGDRWAISRPNRFVVDCEGEGVCGSEYGELLHLNRRGTKILRALPLPSVPPQYISVTEDAAYCGRAGDGGLPHSMVCRMDARTFETTVRVFWGKDNRAQPPEPSLLPGWKLHEEYLPMYAFEADDGAVWAKDFYDGNTWTKLDPLTLEIVEQKVERADP